MSTRRYLIGKILQALLTLAFVLAFNFFLFRGLGNPVELQSRGHGAMTAAAIKEENHVLGLDLPLPQQFLHYVKETVTGHLGFTLGGTPVTTEIGARVWPTVLLIGTSTIASIALGVYIGIVQGWRRGSKFDKSMLGVTLVLYAMPEFWFGLLMIMLFSVTLNIFPSGGMQTTATDLHGITLWLDIGKHLALPFFVLTVSYLAEYSIIMRSSLMEVLTEDFIATARAKGVREKLVRRRHAVPNALLPTMTITILSLGYVLGGAIVIEAIFSWPGLGGLTYLGIQERDNALLQGLFLIFSAAVIVSNVVADLLYSYLDPRVRAA